LNLTLIPDYFRKQQAQLSTNEDSHAEEEGNDQPEMTRMEIDMAR
jgi:hypothetical protein